MSPTLRFPFGGSLDRDTGAAVVTPATMRDVRNMHPRRGRAEARKGTELASMLPDQGGNPCTSVPLIHPIQSEQAGVAIGHYEASREAHLYLVGGDGTNPQHLGLWFTLDVDARPHFTGADNFGIVMLAHDEPLIQRRAPTKVYNTNLDTLENLTAEFDAAGEAPVRFRGVRSWADFMIGWGFGTATQNHPEYVRVSLPGQPTEFESTHYFIAGNRGVPVTTCAPAGDSLVAFKLAECFRTVGQSHLNFGIMPLYELVGCIGSRLAITVEGICFFWTTDGVRYTTVSETGDLGLTLDLGGPAPADLPSAADLENGFAVYVPDARTIEWHFGDRIYALSLDEKEGPKWSYVTRPFAAASGGLLYAGGAVLGSSLEAAPTGHANITSVTPLATGAVVEWNNVDSDENEIIEVWLQEEGAAWAMVDEFLAEGATQDTTLSELEITTNYEVALRYRRAGLYTTGYTAEDPGEWPAASRESFSTDLASPEIVGSSWERTASDAEAITVEVDPAYEDQDIQLIRDATVVATATAPHTGNVELVDTAITGEQDHEYTVRHIAGAIEGDLSAPHTRWAGPDAPSGLNFTLTSVCGYTANWTTGDATAETEVEDDWPDTVHTLRETAAAAATSQAVSHGDALETCDGAGVLIAVSVRIRHKFTAFTVDDFSKYDQRDDLQLCDNCASA